MSLGKRNLAAVLRFLGFIDNGNSVLFPSETEGGTLPLRLQPILKKVSYYKTLRASIIDVCVRSLKLSTFRA